MGAGKTTIGQILGRMLGWEFVDLDSVIEQREGISVREIFESRGERVFRSMESAALEKCLEMNRTVIALGGGAYVVEENRTRLREIGVTVWLDCPLEVCYGRIAGDASRPLLRTKEETRRLYKIRRAAYALADLSIETGDRPPEELVVDILDLLAR